MKIKKTVLALSLFGLIGASTYAMAQNYVFRQPTNGVKESGTVSDLVNETEEQPEVEESLISSPTNLVFGEYNESLSGNVGNIGTVTIFDDSGDQVGQTSSNENGDFNASLDSISGSFSLDIVVTDGIETLTVSIAVTQY